MSDYTTGVEPFQPPGDDPRRANLPGFMVLLHGEGRTDIWSTRWDAQIYPSLALAEDEKASAVKAGYHEAMVARVVPAEIAVSTITTWNLKLWLHLAEQGAMPGLETIAEVWPGLITELLFWRGDDAHPISVALDAAATTESPE